MKNYITVVLSALLVVSCNSQENKKNGVANKEKVSETPRGSWKVNREFDEEGNLIRYDSVYSWSSGTDMDALSALINDSTLQSLRSRFYRNFSDFDLEREGFGGLFSEDSLLKKHFFNDEFFTSEFGEDFMDIDKLHERMQAMQKEFLERYRPLMRPQHERDSVNEQ